MSTGRQAEMAVRDLLKNWGVSNVRLTPSGADGGVDVRGNNVVGQVKDHWQPTGRADIQRLHGIAALEGADAVFFSFSGFTDHAVTWANVAGVALFRLSGLSATAVNSVAHEWRVGIGLSAEERLRRRELELKQAEQAAQESRRQQELELERAQLAAQEEARRLAASEVEQATKRSERRARLAGFVLDVQQADAEQPCVYEHERLSGRQFQADPVVMHSKELPWLTARLIWNGRLVVALRDRNLHSNDEEGSGDILTLPLSLERVLWWAHGELLGNHFCDIASGDMGIALADVERDSIRGGADRIRFFDGISEDPKWSITSGEWLGVLSLEAGMLFGEASSSNVSLSLSNGNWLWARDALTGQLLWNGPTTQRSRCWGIPAVTSGTVVSVRWSWDDDRDPAIVILDRATGREDGSCGIEIECRRGVDLAFLAAAGIVATESIILAPTYCRLGTGAAVAWVAFDHRCRRLWRSPPVHHARSTITNRDPLLPAGRPLVIDDLVVISAELAPEYVRNRGSGAEGAVMALDSRTGEARWARRGMAPWIAVDGAYIWLPDETGAEIELRRVDTGQLVWMGWPAWRSGAPLVGFHGNVPAPGLLCVADGRTLRTLSSELPPDR